MAEEKKYCVAAEDRDDGKRKSITGSMTKEEATAKKIELNKNSQYKKWYKYFHVAAFPYKTKNNHG